MSVFLAVLILISLVLGVLGLRMLLKSPAAGSSGEWEGNRRQWLILLPLLALDIALMVYLGVREYRVLLQLLGLLHLIAALYVARGRRPGGIGAASSSDRKKRSP